MKLNKIYLDLNELISKGVFIYEDELEFSISSIGLSLPDGEIEITLKSLEEPYQEHVKSLSNLQQDTQWSLRIESKSNKDYPRFIT